MATAKANHLPALALYVIRPALVEARLMTEKLSHDAVYVTTLTEELRGIEQKIAAMEEALHLTSHQKDAPASDKTYSPPQDGPNAKWIRAKSTELDYRHRRIEQFADSTQVTMDRAI